MSRTLLAAAALAASLAAAIPSAYADEAKASRSVQCILAFSAAPRGSNPQASQAVAIATNFFAGQAFGAAPDIGLTALMRREASRMTVPQIRTLLAECGSEIQKRSGQLNAAAKAVLAEGIKPKP